jgi:hypothetical protein
MSAMRWARRAAFAGAAGLTVVAFWPAGANAAATPPTTYSLDASASGVDYTVDRNPGFSAVQGVTSAMSPRAASVLGGNSSNALADAVYPGTAQGVPDLLCGQVKDPNGNYPCYQVPAPSQVGFPPKNPVEATAQYPTQPDSKSLVSPPALGAKGSAVHVNAGQVEAHAHATTSSAIANTTSSSLGTKQLLTGAVRTSTSTFVDAKGRVISRAESLVQDIRVKGVVKIGAVKSIAEIINDGKHKPTVNTSTTVSGVTVAGQPAVIDDKGIRITKATDDKGKTLTQINQQLAEQFASSGLYFYVVKPTVSYEGTSAAAHASGLVIKFNWQLTQPFNPDFTIPGCKNPFAGPPFNGALPVDPCSGAQLNPNGNYFGTVDVAAAGVGNSAAFISFDLGGGGLGGGGLGGTGGPTTTVVPGTSGTPGTAGTPGIAGTPGTQPGPQIAGGQQAVGFVEDLSDVAQRLKYLFPALLLGVLGFIAGRVGRAPARLPARG